MGQYYVVANLTKQQFLHPHKFGDGMKLLEFGRSACGTMTGLAVLLANSNGRGGGDLRSEDPVVGSWAGDRVVAGGDYAVAGDAGEQKAGKNIYLRCTEGLAGWKDVSDAVLSALADDEYVAFELAKGLRLGEEWSLRRGGGSYPMDAALRAKLLRGPAEGEDRPLHVLLAEAVLKTPDDRELWQPLVDALLELNAK